MYYLFQTAATLYFIILLFIFILLKTSQKQQLLNKVGKKINHIFKECWCDFLYVDNNRKTG